MASSKPAKDLMGQFPAPMIIQSQQKHLQTLIILHGRGSYASKFGPPLLETTVDGQTLQTAFPHAKVIFPTAAKSKATMYKNPTHQWFDNWHLEEYRKRQHLMVDGLNRSCGYMHGLLKEAVQEVRGENVVLWGLSQGCATALVSLLTWEGQELAGVVGMCGWLPFGNELVKHASGNQADGSEAYGDEDDPFVLSGDRDEDEDPFARSDDSDNDDDEAGPAKAVKFLREAVDMEHTTGMVFQKTPVFLGHGIEDDKVSIGLGREAKTALELMGMDVQMKEYESLQHWYSENMLRDIFRFIKEKLKIEKAEE
jgi:predicted esterase